MRSTQQAIKLSNSFACQVHCRLPLINSTQKMANNSLSESAPAPSFINLSRGHSASGHSHIRNMYRVGNWHRSSIDISRLFIHCHSLSIKLAKYSTLSSNIVIVLPCRFLCGLSPKYTLTNELSTKQTNSSRCLWWYCRL